MARSLDTLAAELRQELAPIAGHHGGDWMLEVHDSMDAIIVSERLRGLQFTITRKDLEDGTWRSTLRTRVQAAIGQLLHQDQQADVAQATQRLARKVLGDPQQSVSAPSHDATKAQPQSTPQSPREPSPGHKG